jgi:hypothetical protein
MSDAWFLDVGLSALVSLQTKPILTEEEKADKEGSMKHVENLRRFKNKSISKGYKVILLSQRLPSSKRR